ncbi:tetratricopeptide repeat protein [Brevundimonas bullata]|uniref:KGGVGR-motif variant AAA ATPase n=1 Tax=Brevundimonas bullata TaxID=13160 RepID=UPI000E0B90C9|nr:tetratricopeptide repeat protein [Brevundimonas bullata]WQE37317.1 tetratricopeptide repeat protein [Brevundimonas bullata]
MIDPAAGGRITTFYSFKGGVGRTMAMANVAFLAAMNGLKVLVMDWDLEAPGLDFYFRGLSDPTRAREIKSAEGVLDLAWAWRRRLLGAESETDVHALLEEYDRGAPFAACACSVLDDGRHETGRLDIIGAGSEWIEDEERLSYAEALVRFSWTDFVDYYGGGLFIERLRKWAKSNYDLILVDSRTGFADVAGLCTIQLPDTVALTFIYNRQNIEGIAKVAASIHAERGGAVTLRAVPMRTSRHGLLDEAEARSRAATALHRTGAFSADRAKSDVEHLGVRAAQNVPFYETLAPFAAPSARDDQLSLDYRKLAEQIVGRELQLVEISPAWRESVNRRLEYKTVTVAYLNDLREADPPRIAEELERLMEGAAEAELYDGLDGDYLLELADLAIDLESLAFDEVDPALLEHIARQAIELLRHRAEQEPLAWSEAYAIQLERFQTIYDPPESPSDMFDQLQRWDEIVSGAAWTPSTMLRRSRYRRRMATLRMEDNPEAAMPLIEEAIDYVAGARDAGASAEEADTSNLLLMKAQLLVRLGRIQEAKQVVDTLLPQLDSDPNPDRRRLSASAHLLMLRHEEDPERAASHLERALEDEYALIASPNALSDIVEVAGRSTNRGQHALTLMRRMSSPRSARLRTPPSVFFGRTVSYAWEYISASAKLVAMAANQPRAQVAPVVADLLKATSQMLAGLIRRYEEVGVGRSLRKPARAILSEMQTLIQVGTLFDVPADTISGLIRSAEALEGLMSRSIDE